MRVITARCDIDSNDDGVTHINIYSGGQTELGRFLSNFTYWTQVTDHGIFNSLEGYYHYLKLMRAVNESDISGLLRGAIKEEIEALKGMYGKQAQDYGRQLRQRLMNERIWINDHPSEFFYECFRKAVITKIESSHFKTAFEECTLPFTHYYLIGDKVIYKPHFSWLEELVNKIRFGV